MRKTAGVIKSSSVVVVIALLIPTCIGCSSRLPVPLQAQQMRRGCLVMLPGVDGDETQLTQTVLGLRQAGCDSAVDIIVWGGQPFGFVVNLIDYQTNLKRASRIASRIAEYRRAAPDRPIVLVGFSGGGGLAVLVAEALPEGVYVDRIVLVAAALSPRHDLTKALEHSRNGLINFYSEQDRLLLGLGTRLLGTIDRQYTSSAGHVGFRDDDGNLLEAPHMKQIAWRPDWIRMGCDGKHMGWLSRRWARRVLAPELVPTPAFAQAR